MLYKSACSYSFLSYTIVKSDDIISTFYFVISVKVSQRNVFPDKMAPYTIPSIFETKFLAARYIKLLLTIFILLFDMCTTYTHAMLALRYCQYPSRHYALKCMYNIGPLLCNTLSIRRFWSAPHIHFLHNNMNLL